MRIDRVIASKVDEETVEIVFLEELPGRALARVGDMRVTYFGESDPLAGQVHSVEVRSEDGGLTASALQRLGWSKWLAMADATARRSVLGTRPYSDPYVMSGNPEEDPEGWGPRIFPGEEDDRYGSWFMGLGGSFERSPTPPTNSRPGRQGHPHEHYERIAARYLALRAEGARDPTARIAREMIYSRNTVAGWVRRARELGLLPPARRGRAG